MKNLFFLLFTGLVAMSCSSKVDLAIDNPTESPIIVMVDSLTVEVPAKEVVWVEMGPGERTLKLPNDSVVKHNFTEKAYMLNPTLSEYLVTEEYYGPPTYQHMISKKINKVEFYGLPLEGNFQVVKALVNPVTWDYSPREPLPDMIEMDANYEIIKKLMDINDFKAMIEQYEQQSQSEQGESN